MNPSGRTVTGPERLGSFQSVICSASPGPGRMRGQHQRVANGCPQRLAFVQQCHYDLSAIGIARPASIVDGIEIQERQHVGLLLHDLARRGTLDQEQGRRTGFNAVDNQRNRIVHRETDDRAGRGIVHLQNPRKRSLQMDRTGLQLQRSESGGEGLGIDRNALGLAQPFDAPETINVRRPANPYELKLN